MNEKREALYNGITFLDDDILQDAESFDPAAYTKRGWHNPFARFAAIAACILLVAGTLFTLIPRRQPGTTIEPIPTPNLRPIVSDAGVTIPKMNASLSSEQPNCMIPFFLYDGKEYSYLAPAEDNTIRGEYLGTATGLIDAWTPKDGYVDLAGSVEGDFFTVQGTDSTFLVCFVNIDGSVEFYANSTGITLNTGSDLYRDRIPVQDHYVALSYQSYEDWFYDRGNINTLGPDMADKAEEFLDLLQDGIFIPRTGELDLEELPHVYVEMDTGLTLHLIPFEDGSHGYILLDNFYSVYLMVDKESLDSFTFYLKNPGDP